MKTSLALFCALLVLGLGAAGAGILHTANTAERVKTWSVLEGEPVLSDEKELKWSPNAGKDRVQDLKLEFRVHNQQQLLWDLALYPAREPEHPQTEFQMRYKEKDNSWPIHDQSVEMISSLGFSSSTSGGSFDLGNDAETYGLGPAFEDVSSRTPAGQAHTETVELKKYFEVWPMTIGMETAGYWLHWQEFGEMRQSVDEMEPDYVRGTYKLVDHLLKSFRFPIQSNPKMEITVEKDESGAVIGLEAYPVGQQENSASISNYETQLNGTHYLAVEAREEDGSLMDYSLTPGGYGVYRLPVYGEKECPAPEDLQFLCPLDPQEQLVQLTDDGTNLLLVTKKEQQLFLNALDESGTCLYRVALEQPFGVDWVQIYAQDDLVLVLEHGPNPAEHAFMLLQRDSEKGYQRQMDGRLPGNKAFESLVMPNGGDRGINILFDGERLAIAAPYGRDFDGDCGYSVLVYDRQGLLFADARQTSLSQGMNISYQDQCHVDAASMKLSLEPKAK